MTRTEITRPMTRNELLQARKWRAAVEGVELPPNSGVRLPVALSSEPPIPAFGFMDGDGAG
jgi:hypothetical protein